MLEVLVFVIPLNPPDLENTRLPFLRLSSKPTKHRGVLAQYEVEGEPS